MPKRTWFFAVALIAIGNLASAQHALHCMDLNPEEPQDAYRAFECVSKLDADLTAALERADNLSNAVQELTTIVESLAAQSTSTVPGDAIVAFDSPGRCPEGWSEFADGQGRMIVGASFGIPDGLFRNIDLTERKYRDHGGAETVTLTEAQMPAHSHGPPNGYLFWWYKKGGGANHKIIDTWSETVIESGYAQVWEDLPLKIAGNSQPHNNMPPYIALYFCKKD